MAVPAPTTWEEFAALRAAPPRWLPLLHDVARRHGLGGLPIEPIAGGSNIVAALGDDLVIKLTRLLLLSGRVSSRDFSVSPVQWRGARRPGPRRRSARPNPP